MRDGRWFGVEKVEGKKGRSSSAYLANAMVATPLTPSQRSAWVGPSRMCLEGAVATTRHLGAAFILANRDAALHSGLIDSLEPIRLAPSLCPASSTAGAKAQEQALWVRGSRILRRMSTLRGGLSRDPSAASLL